MSDADLSYADCRLCPRACGVDRHTAAGFCGETETARVAWSGLHFGEEPPISAAEGSGTVFFCGCNLGCIFCQNRGISRPHSQGRVFSETELAALFLRLQEADAENVNLVTGTPHAPLIIAALKKAKNGGLTIPVVWNSSGYETLETIAALNAVVDIYLADFKTADRESAQQLFNAADYPKTAAAAIRAMCLAKPPLFADFYNDRLKLFHPLMKQGVIVRHLALPGAAADSQTVIDRYERDFRPLGAVFSLLTDYLPFSELPPPLNRRLSPSEETILKENLIQKGWDDCFFQESEECAVDWTPDFTRREPFPAGFSKAVF